jgi:hypothetical protein
LVGEQLGKFPIKL